MFKVRVERLLNKNIEQTFAAISDHAAYKNYNGVTIAEVVEPGRDNPNGLGALRHMGSATADLWERITVFEPPHRMDYHIERAKPLGIDHRKGSIQLTAEGDKTRVVWESEGHLQIPLAGHVLDKLAEPQIVKLFNSILRGVEQAPDRYT